LDQPFIHINTVGPDRLSATFDMILSSSYHFDLKVMGKSTREQSSSRWEPIQPGCNCFSANFWLLVSPDSDHALRIMRPRAPSPLSGAD
jgi:hypothetical protein